jgi:hypothetical protein
MTDWNLQHRDNACHACSQPFADRQPYHTLLYDERGEYQRQDVCGACWTAQFSQGAAERKGFVSHWQGEFIAPPPAPPDPIQRETAESLLRKLTAQNDPQFRAASFILAVMLERKRLLKVRAQSHEGGVRIFHYEEPRTGDLFTIPDPNLRLDQLDEVQRQVAQLMQAGPPDAASAVAVAPPSDAAQVEATPTAAEPAPAGA